jgi:hypothetical protein
MYNVAITINYLYNLGLICKDFKACNIFYKEDKEGNWKCFVSGLNTLLGLLKQNALGQL